MVVVIVVAIGTLFLAGCTQRPAVDPIGDPRREQIRQAILDSALSEVTRMLPGAIRPELPTIRAVPDRERPDAVVACRRASGIPRRHRTLAGTGRGCCTSVLSPAPPTADPTREASCGSGSPPPVWPRRSVTRFACSTRSATGGDRLRPAATGWRPGGDRVRTGERPAARAAVVFLGAGGAGGGTVVAGWLGPASSGGAKLAASRVVLFAYAEALRWVVRRAARTDAPPSRPHPRFGPSRLIG